MTGILVLLAGCASGPPTVPYPAFIAVDELPDSFVAGLPGVRAKLLAGDSHTRRSGSRILIPADWAFSSGASPGHSVEIFVLAGKLFLGEYELVEGGYAYLPSGTTGMPMRSDDGALILYFLDIANERAVIRTPLITNSALLDWSLPTLGPGSEGLSTKELRADPGSGARTWLLRMEPGSSRSWQYDSQSTEGYLLSGNTVESECVSGKPATFDYFPGGYFQRPAGAVFGGPEAGSATGATWFLRVPGHSETTIVPACRPEAE